MDTKAKGQAPLLRQLDGAHATGAHLGERISVAQSNREHLSTQPARVFARQRAECRAFLH
jgi:hypothetical protein